MSVITCLHDTCDSTASFNACFIALTQHMMFVSLHSTHTHTHTHTHADAHTHTHARTHKLSHTHTHAQTVTHTHTHCHTHTRTHTHTPHTHHTHTTHTGLSTRGMSGPKVPTSSRTRPTALPSCSRFRACLATLVSECDAFAHRR
jgi:hypothetical protein